MKVFQVYYQKVVQFIFPITLTFLIFFSQNTFSAKENKATLSPNNGDMGLKNKLFQDYLKADLKIRTNQEKKWYLEQLLFLKETHTLRLEYLNKLNSLKLKLSFGKNEENMQIKDQIKRLKNTFQTTMKERRGKYLAKTMKPDLDKFQKKLIKRKEDLSASLKK